MQPDGARAGGRARLPDNVAVHRQVFFISGFDPKSARHYHRLYREAAARRPNAPLPGHGEMQVRAEVLVGERAAAGPWVDAWDVHWGSGEGTETAPLLTRYHVMRWDDIVRHHWPRNLRQSLLDHVRVYGVGAWQGVFGRVRKLAPAAFRLSLVPLALSLGSLLCTALALLLLGRWAPWPAAWSAALALPAWLLVWRGLEARIGSEWLLRLYGFTEAQADGRLPELEQRLQTWAEAALASLRAHPCEEVLVVGHSTGGMLAVDLLDRMLAAAPSLGRQAPRLSLLTLGHCMPILAGLDHARAFRAALGRVADCEALDWLDVSAPADWAAFAQVGPWLGDGRARRRQVSPRFHQTMSEAAYRDLLRDRQALHLHYLRPQERAGGYDVVALTAGPSLLCQRMQAESPWSV